VFDLLHYEKDRLRVPMLLLTLPNTVYCASYGLEIPG